MRGKVIAVLAGPLLSVSACAGSELAAPPPSTVTVTSTIAASAVEQQRIDSAQAALDQREHDLDVRESAIATSEAMAASNTFTGDGVFVVGQDIQPGMWRSDGGNGCYWERLSSINGTGSALIQNDFAEGQTFAEIAPTDAAFETTNCGTWTRIG